MHAFSVSGGGVTRLSDGVELTMGCEPASDLVLAGDRLAVHFVTVPDLPHAPVDYSSLDAEIRRGTPSWQHPGRVVMSWGMSP